MRITTKSRYAVRALVNLAMRGREKPVSLSLIAEDEGISLNFLEQIFMALRKARIVKSIRGPSGGYKLERAPEEISIASVIQAVGEPIFPVWCVDAHFRKEENPCPRGNKCMTKHCWRELGDNIRSFLNAFTIADILSKGSV